jgi:hypothetical protein
MRFWYIFGRLRMFAPLVAPVAAYHGWFFNETLPVFNFMPFMPLPIDCCSARSAAPSSCEDISQS